MYIQAIYDENIRHFKSKDALPIHVTFDMALHILRILTEILTLKKTRQTLLLVTIKRLAHFW